MNLKHQVKFLKHTSPRVAPVFESFARHKVNINRPNFILSFITFIFEILKVISLIVFIISYNVLNDNELASRSDPKTTNVFFQSKVQVKKTWLNNSICSHFASIFQKLSIQWIKESLFNNSDPIGINRFVYSWFRCLLMGSIANSRQQRISLFRFSILFNVFKSPYYELCCFLYTLNIKNTKHRGHLQCIQNSGDTTLFISGGTIDIADQHFNSKIFVIDICLELNKLLFSD